MECTIGLCRLSSDLSLLVGVWVSSLVGALSSLTDAAPFVFPFVAGCLGTAAAVLATCIANSIPRRRGWPGAVHDEAFPLLSPSPLCGECGRVALFALPVHLMGKGRCPDCDASLPPARPAFEVGMFVASAAVAIVLGPSASTLGVLLILWWGAVVAWFDWATSEIPDFLTFPLLFLGAAMSPFDPDVLSRVLGAGLAAGFVLGAFAAVSRIKDVDANSYGDVAFCAALGAWVGVCGALPFVLVSTLVYGAYAWKPWRDGVTFVPMGPGLAVGGVLVAATGLGL